MVGKGVLLECLEHKAIQEILLINRTAIEMKHPKISEVLLTDFSVFTSIQEHFSGCDACFHCMGVSSVGMSEEKYNQLTFKITKNLADTVFGHSPNLVFNYISGTGTDSSEKGKIMWARVKGKTENYLFNKGFKDAYAFRPGIILPEKGVKSKTGWYNTIYAITRPFFPLFKKFASVTTSSRLGQAMINTVFFPSPNKKLDNKHINLLAQQTAEK